jgi:CRISPR-associated protein Cas6
MESQAKVDLSFRVAGQTLPVDHGFALYGALSNLLPILHEDQEVGVKLIRGRYVGNGMLDISPFSELVFRLPLVRAPQYIRLAGRSLDVLGNALRVGISRTNALIPSVALFAQLVTTKNGNDQSRFETEIRNQMEKLEVRGRPTIGKRRTFQVHGKQVVAYSLLMSELTAAESVALQEHGLGGRQKMGCGFFEVRRK